MITPVEDKPDLGRVNVRGTGGLCDMHSPPVVGSDHLLRGLHLLAETDLRLVQARNLGLRLADLLHLLEAIGRLIRGVSDVLSELVATAVALATAGVALLGRIERHDSSVTG